MNICHIISGDLWAGAQCQVVHLVSELVKNSNLRLSAITFNRGRLTDELEIQNLRVTCLPEERLSSIKLLLGIRKHIDDNEVDIIHCHGHKEHILGCLASCLSRKHPKVVRTLHGLAEPYSGIAEVRARFFDWLQEACMRYFTEKIIVVSHDMEKRLSGKSWAGKIICIHNGMNARKITATLPRGEMRRRLAIKEDEFVIGTACRLVPIKRLDLLLEAFQTVNENHPETLLVIGGDGPLRAKLHEHAERLGIAPRVRLLGHRDDIYDVMSIFDLFVMTSKHEGIPMVLLEALALGIPVVAPPVGGIPEVVSVPEWHMTNALNSEWDIAALINEFIIHSDRAACDHGRCPSNLSQEFLAETTAAAAFTLYESIVRD